MAPILMIDRGHQDLHVWVGPVGLHLFWPQVWASRPDWCAEWRHSA